MKRIIATTLIISVVMCLLMAFPANAAKNIVFDGNQYGNLNGSTEVELYEAVKEWIKNNPNHPVFNGKPYFAWFHCVRDRTDGRFHGIMLFTFSSPTPTSGMKFGRIMFDNYKGLRVPYSYVETPETWNNVLLVNTSSDEINKISNPYMISGSGLHFAHYLESISTAKINVIPASLYGDIVNSAALTNLIIQAKAKQNIGYTISSWNTLKLKITAAENVLSDTNKTQVQVDSAKNALQSALDGLVLLPDASVLESLLVESELMQNTGYTQSSWNTLQIQIAAAKSLLNNKNYTKSQIDNMLGALQTAIYGLVFLPDASFLEQLIADAQTYVDEKYTELSLQILNSKIMQAIILLDNKDYVTAQIDNAIAELANAINGLVLVNQPEPPIIEPPETKPPIIEVIGDKWYSLSGEQKKYADLTDGIQPEHLEPIKEAVTDNMQVARMYGFWAFIITLLPLITVIVIIGFVRNSSDDYSSIDAPRELGSGGGTPLLARPRWKSNVSGKNIDID